MGNGKYFKNMKKNLFLATRTDAYQKTRLAFLQRKPYDPRLIENQNAYTLKSPDSL